MTIDDRYVIDLSDLQAIRFDCKQCGVSIIYRVSDWRRVPEECPSCHASWHRGEQTEEYQALQALMKGLQVATTMMSPNRSQPVPFTVRFEMARPKS